MSEAIVQIFKKYDKNGDGAISRNELKSVLGNLDPSFDVNDVGELIDGMDANEDGKVQYNEFVEWVMAGGDDDEGATLSFKALNAPFMQLHAPNGQTWAEYCAPVRPTYLSDGRLTGPWADCIRMAAIFEKANPTWYEWPEYTANGPGGYVIEFLFHCGYGDHEEGVAQAEEAGRAEMEAAQDPDSRTFLRHKARNLQTWEKYLRQADVQTQDSESGEIVCGAWGEAMTAGAIFEAEMKEWKQLGPFSADGPCGQIFNYLNETGQNEHFDALDRLEKATHAALRNGDRVPVFNHVNYQVPVGVEAAEDIGVSVDDDPPEPSGRKKALLVGCNYPGTSAQLSGCINDVMRWRDVLQKYYGFEDEDFMILIDEGEEDPKKKSFRANILQGIRWLVEGAEPGDALFFQFSGHGSQRSCPNSTEVDGKDEVLINCDYTTAGVLVDHELFDCMVVPLKSGVKLTVLLDCCHSGSALDLPFEWQQADKKWNRAPYPWDTAGDVQMFSGCEDNQCSMDAYRHGKPGGAMTTAMCDVIEERNGDPITYPDLLDALHAVLVKRNFEQRPRLSSSQSFDPMGKIFSFTEGAEPNRNPEIGQKTAPPPKEARANAADVENSDGTECSVM